MSPLPRIVALTLAVSCALADQRGDNPDSQPSTPQEELAKFHVPPGFEVQLVASEPEIQKPINLNFDAAGRLWVTGSESYPWPASVDATGQPIPGFEAAYTDLANAFRVGDQAPPPSNVARDTVRVLSDFDATGKARKITIFADGLNIPSGVQPLPRAPGAKGDSVIVYSIPNIWRLEDTDGDGKADKREVLYGPFGYLDTHGGSSSYIAWIDGWIYGTHGFRNHSEVHDRQGRVTVLDSGNTYRFKPDGSKFEIYTHGQTNPFGLAFDPLGNLYSADSHSKPVYQLVRGGYYEGIGKQHDGLGFAPAITNDDHGSSAIGGIIYYADERWPEEYHGNLFNGNPVTQKINRDRLEWHGATPKAIRQPDFVTSDDPWFRPVNLKLGPDGALYIADFYNPIIGHYEVPLTDPHRDHSHGRIWRVVWKGLKDGSTDAPTPLPNLTKLDASGLLEKLGDPNLEVRRLATNELVERIGKEAIPSLKKAVTMESGTDTAWKISNRARAHALWALARLGGLDASTATSNLNELAAPETASLSSRYAQAAVVHIAAESEPLVTDLKIAASIESLAQQLQDPNADAQRIAEYSRAWIEAAAAKPSRKNLLALTRFSLAAPLDDTELTYATKVAIRETLKTEGGCALATGLAEENRAYGPVLAEIALAVPTPEAAEFLLTQLSQGRLTSRRAGDYLKHAVLNLPETKIDEIAALVTRAADLPWPQQLTLADGLSQAVRQRGLTLPDPINTWVLRSILSGLSSGDDVLARRAVDAARELKLGAKLEPLSRIVQDDHRDQSLRVAALEASANLPESRELLLGILRDPNHLALRKRAAELLIQSGAIDVVLGEVPNAPQELVQAIAGALAKTDAGCAALLATAEAGRLSPRLLLNKAVSGPLGTRPKPLRDRAAALTRDLPPEDARLNAVIAERAAAFAKAQPDRTRGALVFQQNCAVCHRFRNAGGNVGPNLDGVVARGPSRLIEDILDPNRNVDPLFRQTTIETTDGQSVIGANLRDQGDTILLADPTGKDQTIPKARIKKQTVSTLSLMPPIFESAIPSADFNDLLSYLLSPANTP